MVAHFDHVEANARSLSTSCVRLVIDRAMAAAGQAGLLLTIGSTLQVYPVASVVPLAKVADARVVITINQPTPDGRLR